MNKLNMKLRAIRTQKEVLSKAMEKTEDKQELSILQSYLYLLSEEEKECLEQMGVEL